MTVKNRPLKVCFSLIALYPMFRPSSRVRFGGSEVRCKIFIDGLSKESKFDLSAVVIDDGQPSKELFDRTAVYRHPVFKSSSKHSLLKKLLTKLGYKKANLEVLESDLYAEINSDIYCTFGASDYAARLARFCKSNGRKLVLFLGSDSDIGTDYLDYPEKINHYGSLNSECLFSLRSADVIIAQTENQQRLAFQRFGLKSVLIRNPFRLDDVVADRVRDTVLWVGKSDEVKQPEIFCKLAESFKSTPISWTMVLNRSDADIFNHIRNIKPSNVKILEQVKFEEMKVLFDRSIALVNTSLFEGFPNTFLQAGNSAVPIFSLSVDPDGFISRGECGFCADGDVKNLTEKIHALLTDSVLRSRFSKNVRSYVESFHNESDRVRELSEVFSSLAQGPVR